MKDKNNQQHINIKENGLRSEQDMQSDNPQKLKLDVISVTALQPTIYQINLALPFGVSFLPGQYLNVIISDQDARPFSIASVKEENIIQLHIGGSELNKYSQDVIDVALQTSQLEVELPFGDCWLRTDSNRPLLLIAGGTGFSYIRPLLISALNENRNNPDSTRPIYFYWGAKVLDHLYELEAIENWCKLDSHLDFRPVLQINDEQWQGRTGTVLEAIDKDFYDLAEFDIYLAGRIELAKAAKEHFVKNKNVKVENLFSDIYAYI